MRRTVLAAAVLLLTACGTSPVTGLSPAPTPATVAGDLAVSFQLAFPPGFWEPGGHGYRIELHCPSMGVHDEPAANRFDITTEAPARTDTVYFRNFGASTGVLLPIDTRYIHPDTPTAVAVTLVGLTEDAVARALDDCAGTVVYDGLGPFDLSPVEPFSP